MTQEERVSYMKKWREEHRGYAKKYYEEHKERMTQQTRAWGKNHPEQLKATRRKYYAEHKPVFSRSSKSYWKNGGKEQRHRKNQPVHDFVNAYKIEHGCSICGVKGLPPECYDFHHIDPRTKIKDLGTIAHSNTLEKAKREIEKCVVVCANCHRQLTSGTISLNAHEV